MKLNIPTPYHKLTWFLEKLEVLETDMDFLRKYATSFSSKQKIFAEHLHHYFLEIPETSFFIEHEERQGLLQQAWMDWFDGLFRVDLNQSFLAYLWKSGLRHVEINIDHKFIVLAYAVVRQFCERVAQIEVPPPDRESVLFAIDKLIDFCLLIETQAYIEATTQCDLEVVKGFSHQIRNPLTIIGGNILRLKKKRGETNPENPVFDAILDESHRLEKMVSDMGMYSDMYQAVPNRREVELGEVIENALEEIKDHPFFGKTRFQIALDPEIPLVIGDPSDLHRMFFYLIENALEGADPADPYIRISSGPKALSKAFVEVQIFNNGTPPAEEDLSNLFVPFYSSKSRGTGFGLPIAQLAARKSYGDLFIEPLPGKGTVCIIKLPTPDSSV